MNTYKTGRTISVNVIDLDGCLSDDRHRRHLVHERKYDEYNERCDKDLPANLSVLLPLMDNYVILTSRHEVEAQKTLSWLKRHRIPLPLRMMFRPTGNVDSSVSLKRQMLNEITQAGYRVVTAVDDRPALLDMYREAGVPNVFRVSVEGGRFEPLQVLQIAEGIQKQRAQKYGPTYQRIGKMMKAMMPDGITIKTEDEFTRFCLFHMTVTKMLRYAGSMDKGGHFDSALDLANYGSFLASQTDPDEVEF